jgi:RimJ/RimL family protein N-acetyltransferase
VPVPVFETERLVVRPWTTEPGDLARFYDMYSRWEVNRFLGAHPRVLESVEEGRAKIESWVGRGINAIEVRETGVVAGTVLVKPLPDGDGEIEVGWHLHPDSWGNGYATEAARGAIEHAFAGGLAEIYAVVKPANTASLRVCERLGMTPLGRMTRWYGIEVESFRLRADGGVSTRPGDRPRPVPGRSGGGGGE